jgi:hypothetical protein
VRRPPQALRLAARWQALPVSAAQAASNSVHCLLLRQPLQRQEAHPLQTRWVTSWRGWLGLLRRPQLPPLLLQRRALLLLRRSASLASQA